MTCVQAAVFAMNETLSSQPLPGPVSSWSFSSSVLPAIGLLLAGYIGYEQLKLYLYKQTKTGALPGQLLGLAHESSPCKRTCATCG